MNLHVHTCICVKVDHLDDNLKSIASFKEVKDVKAGPCAAYLELLLFNVVSRVPSAT